MGMEAAFQPHENSFTDFGSIIFALIGRTVQHASESENDADSASASEHTGGPVLADILQHIYLKEPVATQFGHQLKRALQIARSYSGTMSIPADTTRAQQQLTQNVCQVLVLQADCGACGIPTAMLASTLMGLLFKSIEQGAPAEAANPQDFLSEQADLLIAAFKRVSAGKAFSQCANHSHKECCQLAQADLTAAFSLLASYSYSTQHSLWNHGKSMATTCAAAALHVLHQASRLASSGLFARFYMFDQCMTLQSSGLLSVL